MPAGRAEMSDVRWLPDCSPAAIDEALRVAAPGLAGSPIVVPRLVGKDDPVWWSSSAVVADQFVVKFAWSQSAALRVAREARALTALGRHEPEVPFLPEIVVSSTDPVLLVTRLVPGRTLFEVVDSIDRDRAGRQLARFLAALHQPAVLKRVDAALGELPDADRGVQHPATTRALRERFGAWVQPDRMRAVGRWCDWADAVLAPPRSTVLVHADLHGDNQVWEGDELRLVVDFETVAAAEPEYDLRALPGTGPGVELLTATVRHYERITGRGLAVARVMAWHVRTALGDALWRSEEGIPLPDHRTPAAWVDDLSERFSELGIDPETPPADVVRG
jgi:aminoglycoside phosphotransferase (APT) family kinase protein